MEGDSNLEQVEMLDSLMTEARHHDMTDLDLMTRSERLHWMNAQDALVAAAVARELPNIEATIANIVQSFRQGGRLIYVGAGTSGRLGVLDAAECPPTFGTDPAQVVAIIAGGPDAVFRAVEGAEDDRDAGALAVVAAQISRVDSIIGISASGRCPFVAGALEKAVELGAFTAALTNNRPSTLEKIAQVTIAPIVGPEILSGSTRLKSGTSQKMALNMLSTGAMIEMGKTYGDVMVDVRATNEKLKVRAVRITMDLAGVDRTAATDALARSNGSAKLAILALKTGLDPASASKLLNRCDGYLRQALEKAGSELH